MELKLFLKELKCHMGKVSELSYFGLTWNQWAKFAKMTRGLNYGCNFKTRGNPCSGKIGNYGGPKDRQMCCCSSCRLNVGYLDLVPNDEEVIKEIAALFNKNYGFWRKKKGCVLPVKYRSNTCVGYRCSSARKYRDSTVGDYLWGPDYLDQMILYFLEVSRSSMFSATQIRAIIKEIIKGGGRHYDR